MKWSFKLNGKTVTWEIAPVVAIPPSPDFKPQTKAEIPRRPGKHVESNGYEQKTYGYNGYKPPKQKEKRSDVDRQLYERAGWRFVDPAQAGTADVRQVFFTQGDDLLIETKLATVQLTDDCYRKQKPEEILAEDGLKIVQRLGFAPNLYAVRVVSQRSLRDTIDILQKRTDRYVFAEPSMLQTMSGRFTPTDPDFVGQWQHAKVRNNNTGTGGIGLNSIQAWNITKGRGQDRAVCVAVIDNGMDINHEELNGAIIGGGYFNSDPATGMADFVRLEPGMTDFPFDGHGTLCLGMVGARYNNGKGGCGIAPECDLIALACAEDQTGTQLTLARAIAFAVNPQTVDPESELPTGADVISSSLKTATFIESVLQLAIDSAASGRNGLGVPIFWAVSNDEDALISDDPVCSLASVIAVGSSKANGRPAGSAKGTKLEFIAPGEDVFGPGLGSVSVSASGTSFATPLAAGIAALILSRRPTWTATQVRQRMRDTCDHQPNGSGPDPEYGYGRLNAYKAVKP
jgi:hypothetical protein